MKIFVLCNSDSLALPVIHKLNADGKLSGVGIVKKAQNLLLPKLSYLNLAFEPIVLNRMNWVETLKGMLNSTDTETVWVLTFPWKIPIQLLNVPKYGFINFHFGILPKYKGADPIFWQFKNLEEEGGVTVHLMNEAIDEGPVLLQEKMRVMPGENYGLHCMRLGQFSVGFIENIQNLQLSDHQRFIELPAGDTVIEIKPKESDLEILWNEYSAHQIECLVNASNPSYGGARTKMNETEIRVLEVTPVTLDKKIEAKPGQIVFADSIYGVVVSCADKECIRITIAHTGEGYMSGVKLFNLGFTTGHRFG